MGGHAGERGEVGRGGVRRGEEMSKEVCVGRRRELTEKKGKRKRGRTKEKGEKERVKGAKDSAKEGKGKVEGRGRNREENEKERLQERKKLVEENGKK